jgi:hypothetical protein
MPHPLPDEVAAQIRAAILAGHKIQAIKLYREASGAGLKDAKDFIEAIEAELRQTEPESFSPPNKSGCAGMLLAITLFMSILIASFCHLARAQSAQTASATTSPPARHLVAIVGELPIYLTDITPVDTKHREQLIANGKLPTEQAHSLMTKIFSALRIEFAKQNGHLPTDEEVRAVVTMLEETRQRQPPSPVPVREVEMEPLFQMFGYGMVHDWKTSKALYEKYGGRVGFGTIGACSPIEARKTYLEERHKAGDFVIVDRSFENEFWQLAGEHREADVVLSGERLKEQFQHPIWEAYLPPQRDDRSEPPAAAPAKVAPAAAPATPSPPAAEKKVPPTDAQGANKPPIPLPFRPPLRQVSADSVERTANGLLLKGNVRMQIDSTSGDGIFLDIAAESATITTTDSLTIDAAKCTMKVREKDKSLIAVIEGETMTFRQTD